MGRRSKNRVKAVLPVRMWGTDASGQPFSEMVHTLDISSHGARLGGFHGNLKVGDTVGLQYRNYQVRHRVCWVKPAGERDLMLGVESLQPEKEIWSLKMAATYTDDYVVPASPSPPSPRRHERRPNDRRKYTRFPVSGVAVVSNPSGSEKRSLRLGDISLEGCFVETDTLFPAGARLKLLIKIKDAEIETLGTVRASLPGAGMGVQFTHVGASDARRLYTIIRSLGTEQGGTAAAAASSGKS